MDVLQKRSSYGVDDVMDDLEDRNSIFDGSLKDALRGVQHSVVRDSERGRLGSFSVRRGKPKPQVR